MRINLTRVLTPDDEAAFAAVRRPEGTAVEARAVPGDRLIAWVQDNPVARCSCLTAPDLVGAPGVSGMIGYYESLDAEAGVALLERAAQLLMEAGAQRVLGPMNGSTWASYRLALPAGRDDPRGNPPFFLGEPRNPLDYPAQFVRAGFQPCAQYETRSYLTAEERATPEPPLPTALAVLGASLLNLDPARFEETLHEVHALNLEAFADNAYYTPIGVTEFTSAYLPLRSLLDPRLVFLVRDANGALVSFLFGYPDPLWTPHGKTDRAVMKTAATAKRFRGAGIMRFLFALFRARATALGHEEVIHALMHIANTSMRLSGEQHSVLFRRYALYQWRS